MTTKYNVNLDIEPRPENCPEPIYSRTFEVLKNAGLVGIKHINHYGLVQESYDKSCRTFRRGLMRVFYVADSPETMPDILNGLELKLAGNEQAEELLELGREMLKVLGKCRPASVVLPWSLYTTLPICPSMEINTPAGIQSVHYHTQDGIGYGVIQLYKPKKEKDWFDWDTFKDFLFDATLENTSCSLKKRGFFQRIRSRGQEKLWKMAARLSKEVGSNPDCIDKIPDFVKKIKPINLGEE